MTPNRRRVPTWMVALALAAAPALAEPPPRKATILDPGLPEAIDDRFRHAFLHEAKDTLNEFLGVKALVSTATRTITVYGGAEETAAARAYLEDLKRKFVARLAQDAAADPEPPATRREGTPLTTVVQLVVADRAARQVPTSLDPALAKPLGKMFGYRTFQVMGDSFAAGSLGEETELETAVPWVDGKLLSLRVRLKPRVASDGAVSVHARFEVDRVEPENSAAKALGQTKIETTYRPVAGRPTVVGATPLDDARALLFVVKHAGPGVE